MSCRHNAIPQATGVSQVESLAIHSRLFDHGFFQKGATKCRFHF